MYVNTDTQTLSTDSFDEKNLHLQNQLQILISSSEKDYFKTLFTLYKYINDVQLPRCIYILIISSCPDCFIDMYNENLLPLSEGIE